jgi:tRNA-dihydrouridine synthase A
MISRISIAPMMDWTDRHCRYFLRKLSPSVLLYTEMVTAAAINHGDAQRLLGFDPSELPLAVQLGGSDPEALASAARTCEDYGYQEINLNVGCPSDRVQSGQFGACLMASPQLVAECVAAMNESVNIPVTVKTRIGIDDQDSYEFLYAFIETVSAHCESFIVHARKAILQGLSPKENRSVPPLMAERVYRLKRDFPGLEVVINGGVQSAGQVARHLEHVDGVMIGRAAYHDPYLLARLEQQFLNPDFSVPDRGEIALSMLDYIDNELARGCRLHNMTRHMLGLYAGQPGARRWRRALGEQACRPDAGPEVIVRAVEDMSRAGLVQTIAEPGRPGAARSGKV